MTSFTDSVSWCVVLCWDARGLYLHTPHESVPVLLQCLEAFSGAPQVQLHSVYTVIFTSSLIPCILIRNVWGFFRHADAFKRTWNLIYTNNKSQEKTKLIRHNNKCFLVYDNYEETTDGGAHLLMLDALTLSSLLPFSICLIPFTWRTVGHIQFFWSSLLLQHQCGRQILSHKKNIYSVCI